MAEKFVYDQFGGVTRVLHTDDPTGNDFFSTFTTETVEDCEPIVESAKVLADNHKERGDLKHVARVPLTVVEQAMREGWYNDQAKWREWLNNPENRDFRVWKGRV